MVDDNARDFNKLVMFMMNVYFPNESSLLHLYSWCG